MKFFNTDEPTYKNIDKTTYKVAADEYPFEQPDKQKIQYFSRSWEDIEAEANRGRHKELIKLLQSIDKKLDILIELEKQKEDK